LLTTCVSEWANGGVPMIGRNDQSAALGECTNEPPEIITGKAFSGSLGQLGVARTGLTEVMYQIIRPSVPKAPAWLRSD
jgi:hypothetical protein